MPTKANEVIGTAEAAAALHVDRSTLTRWIKSGKIRPFVRGTGHTGEYMFRRNDIAIFSPVASSPSPDDTAGVFAAPTS